MQNSLSKHDIHNPNKEIATSYVALYTSYTSQEV
jgi:hypothetical protein